MTGETQAAEVGTLEEVLAAHWSFGLRENADNTWECECGAMILSPTDAGDLDERQQAHAAAAVRTWYADALTRPEVVEAATRALSLANTDGNYANEDWRPEATAALAAAAEAPGSQQ